jgi:cytochrome c-type biogenesis protein CcmF
MDGNFFLHLTTVIYALVILLIIYKNYFHYKISVAFISFLTLTASICTIIAFLFLLKSYIISDFSLINVAANSHPALPLAYKIGALWGNHDGSLLLLTSYLALFIIIFYVLHNNYQFYIDILLVQVFIIFALLSFLLLSANPFLRSFPVPTTGLGLNPILQDQALIIHPPILYLSHISAAIVYSIVLVVIKKQINFTQYIALLKPWLYLSLSFATLGIGLGSWWAYREIGWGGIWFWDPVETISLLPWILLLTAIHSLNNSRLQSFLIFTSITSFISIILGIFLLRSGIINSIHSFALDFDKGYILLIYLLIASFAPLYYGGLKQKAVKAKLLSKKYLQTLTVILFISFFIILIIGIFFPIITNFIHSKIILTEKFFQKITIIYSIAILCILLFFYFKKSINFIFILTFFFAILFLAKYPIFIIIFPILLNSTLKISIRNFSHLSFVFITVSLLINYFFSYEKTYEIKYGEKILFLSKEIEFQNIQVKHEKNKIIKVIILKIDKSDLAKPSLQIFPIEKQIISEPFIINNLLYDLFFSVQQLSQDKFILSVQYKLMIPLLWLTIFLLFIIILQQAIKSFILYKSHT